MSTDVLEFACGDFSKNYCSKKGSHWGVHWELGDSNQNDKKPHLKSIYLTARLLTYRVCTAFSFLIASK